MTRINLVPPEELTDQHLFAEYREITRVPKCLMKSLLAKSKKRSGASLAELCEMLLRDIPEEFCLGAGHVKFFYDKGLFIDNRYNALVREIKRRGIKLNDGVVAERFFVYLIPFSMFHNDYSPTEEAIALSRARIAERIAMKRSWYRYYGKPL